MLKIELYTEITCPWCIIGQHRLDKVLAESFPGLVADIRHYPVLLL
ncbi:MAG TPA: DsbA family protein, partial [Rhizobium sp.]|nr:DsbA family protein [Rhizobium sp.]